MADVQFKFNCSSGDGMQVSCEATLDNRIYVFIDDDEERREVYLDKSTAIKFAKTLRTEINKIKS